MRRGPDGGRVYHPALPPLGPGDSCPYPMLPVDRRAKLEVSEGAMAAMGLGGWHVFNPSVIERHGHLLVSLRAFHPAVWTAAGSAGCALILGHMSAAGELGELHRVRGGEVEDARLFQDADGVGFVAGVTARGKSTMHVGRLDPAGDVCSLIPIESPRAIEKNWMPLAHGETGLELVYTCSPLQVALFANGAMHPPPLGMPAFDGRRRDPHAGHDGIRGGSQLVRDKDDYLAVVHERTPSLKYVHRFARFDSGLTRVTFGPPWILQHYGIEFVAGLARDPGAAHWVLSYGVEDRQAWLGWCSDEVVKELAP
jgi:hypothetical protein